MTKMTNVIPLPFSGDLIDYLKLNGREIAWLWRDGEAFIPARPICELLGLDWKSQHAKLAAPSYRGTVAIITTVAGDGKDREMLCIAYPDFLMWLATISPGRVKEEAREPLNRLLDEIKLVLAAHYHDRLLGESRAAVVQLQGLTIDYIAMRPIRGRIMHAFTAGWTWAMLLQNTSYTQKRLIEEMKGLIRIGAIPHAVPGTPLQGSDPRQLSLLLEG